MKVVVAEKISSSAVDLLREPRWTVVTSDQLDGKLAAQLESADALIVRSAVQVNAELLEHARKLRVIGRAGVGVDNIDLDAATRKGIAVMNTPGANAIAVAEHTLALMLAMARHIGRANELMHAGIRMAKLEEVYAAADYLSLHVGLTPQTAGMINAESLKKMKPGVRLVNCARGELIDEAALAQGLKQGRVAGAALDVFAEEPPKNSPLTAIENVILTPHIAGSTFEAQEAVGYQIAQQVKEYLKDGVIQNAVTVPSVSHDEYLELQPYIVLAERLGAFLAQVSEGTLEEISLRYSGHIAEAKTELIRNAAVKGILNEALEEKANLVNAAAIAAARGLRIHESRKPKSSSGGSGSVLSVLLKTAGEEHLVKGAVLHKNTPRLLHVDGIDVEAPLERNLIYMRNRDVPGVIGKVGTILGKHKINIADFSLGRRVGNGKPGAPREAIAVVHVDGRVPPEVLAELRKVPAIERAKAIRLF